MRRIYGNVLALGLLKLNSREGDKEKPSPPREYDRI